MATKQLNDWQGKFGDDYTKRNDQSLTQLNKMFVDEYGVSATEMFVAAISELSVKTILEVGCNIGNKLALLYKSGYGDLTGVEPQEKAIESGRSRYPFIKFKRGTIFELSFADNSFDLVFTSGVLIHIAPDDLRRGIKEILRVSRKYVIGFEYFSAKPKEVNYRGRSGLLWKRDFVENYQQVNPELSVIYRKKYYHRSGSDSSGRKLASEMFVLEKP